MENDLLTNTLNTVNNSFIDTSLITNNDIYNVLLLIAFIIIFIFIFSFLDKTFKL